MGMPPPPPLPTRPSARLLCPAAQNCTSAVFFEVRKRTDLYLWMSKCPGGPCVKFHVANVHTMAELKLSGNHLKVSRVT